MATYALTFATRAAFDTSLASGDIYNLMQGVTSSKPSVAITATITESGETFACGTNVMVDIKSVGPGDRVMYDSTNAKYFGIASKWIDNNYPNQPTQHIMIFKTGVLPARFVDCGVCVRRFGNRIRVAGANANLPWSSTNTSDYSWEVAAIGTSSTVVKKSHTTTTTANNGAAVCFPSLRYAEAYYPNGASGTFPITRSAWNAAVESGATTVSGNGVTITLADYDYDFDKYLDINWSPLQPAAEGCYADRNGMRNSRAIQADFIANHGKTASSTDYAAGYCLGYAASAPGLGKGHWFLGTMADINDLRYLSFALPTPYSWSNGRFWSSSQYTSIRAWINDRNASSNYVYKYAEIQVVPLADLILEN